MRPIGSVLRKPVFLLLLLTLGALLVHGYHPWAEDAEIYLPGVEKILHPELFPFGAEFFESHAHLTLFPDLVAGLVKTTHLPLEWVLFVVHVASIFLLLLACWELSGKCFPDPKSRWAGVALIAGLLTLPIAGTALYIMDQYVNPRNLAAFAVIFCIAKVVDGKYLQAALFWLFAAAVHPFMSVFALFLSGLLAILKWYSPRTAAIAVLLPFGLTFGPPSKAYHEAALSHPFHYLLRWEWYEMLGAIAPLVILWWFSRLARARKWHNLDLLCRALIPYGLIATAAALALSIPASWESLARLQPMRGFYILYILLFLFAGGFLAEYLLKNRVWRWLALFAPLCAGMFLAQRALFPASAHVEWPGRVPRNQWVQAFVWIQQNTPVNAMFALDPSFMHIEGEDENGFRAIAERSMLADAGKDSGAVSMFPRLAEEWLRQVQAHTGWRIFQTADFERLRAAYGVDWVVLQQPGIPGARCPYQNAAVLVCENPGTLRVSAQSAR
ncbi:MAG TPA: hypothetical protein VLY24_18760 [Bryobacteraceae bacterium]|nr:hypothetical protein [Bryobacteraceae bacterium]